MSFTNYLEEALLNHVFRNRLSDGGAVQSNSFTRPDYIYVSLHTGAQTTADTAAGPEVQTTYIGNPSGYARKKVFFSAPAQEGGGSAEIVNSAAVYFDVALVNWDDGSGPAEQVTHYGLFDAATNGNCLGFTNVTTPLTVTANQVVSFPAGAIKVRLN